MTTLQAVDSTRELATSMQALSRRFEAIAHNLAHAETSGHKRTVSHLRSFGAELAEAQGRTPGMEAVTLRDFSQGPLVENGDPRQLALEGPGFFAVEWGDEVGYVRTLRLQRGADGSLRDSRGAAVLGTGGSIRVPERGWEVRADGRVEAEGQVLGRLEVVRFEDSQRLSTRGGGVYLADPEQTPLTADQTRVQVGFQERSNVDPLSEMVALVTLQRQYEAAQRALRQNGDLGRALVRSLS